MRLRVSVGREFELDAERVVTADGATPDGRARRVIAYAILTVGGLFLVGAGIIGTFQGSFDELQNVWVVFAPILGAVVGYYFGGRTDADGSKDEK